MPQQEKLFTILGLEVWEVGNKTLKKLSYL